MQNILPDRVIGLAIGLLAVLAMFEPILIAADSPVDVHCGPRCVAFLIKYLSLPDEELRPIINEFDALDNEPGVTFAQLAKSLERRGLTVAAYKIPADSMIESTAPVIVHLNPLSTDSMGHFSVLLPTSTPLSCDAWVGVEGVQSGSPVNLRKLMSGEVLVVSPSAVVADVRRISPARIALANYHHWIAAALPGLVLILIAVLLSRPRTVPGKSPADLGVSR